VKIFRILRCVAGVMSAAIVSSAALAVDALRDQQIATVDAAAGLLAVGKDAATRKIYRCTAETTVLLNDQPAKLTDLEAGMLVVVTAARPGVAARVSAVRMKVSGGEKPFHKVLAERALVVPSANTARQAIVISKVFAGQIVRIVPRVPVRWSSGGARKGQFCDWHGFPGDRVLGMPRMALVAFVGKTPFLATGDRFTFTVPADGMLGFFANDDDAAGNEGSAEVLVTIAWY